MIAAQSYNSLKTIYKLYPLVITALVTKLRSLRYVGL